MIYNPGALLKWHCAGPFTFIRHDIDSDVASHITCPDGYELCVRTNELSPWVDPYPIVECALADRAWGRSVSLPMDRLLTEWERQHPTGPQVEMVGDGVNWPGTA